jgi:hypothetical protein
LATEVGDEAGLIVEGGSHHDTNALGQPLYRQALTELLGLPPR